MKCIVCSTDIITNRSNQKYCSKKCKSKHEASLKSKKPKEKTCQCCQKIFVPYTSLDKFCSANCRVENQKSNRSRRWNPESTQKRIGINNPAYRNGMYTRETKKTSEGNRLFLKVRNSMREEMQNNFGYIFCEHCGTTSTYQFEMHHLIYRSEKPNHEHLHDKRNLINLCIKCHNWYHKNKSNRNELVENRKLYELFGDDIRNK